MDSMVIGAVQATQETLATAAVAIRGLATMAIVDSMMVDTTTAAMGIAAVEVRITVDTVALAADDRAADAQAAAVVGAECWSLQTHD